jgi:hypothetical protein
MNISNVSCCSWKTFWLLIVAVATLVAILMGILSFSDPSFLMPIGLLLFPLCLTLVGWGIGELLQKKKISIGILLRFLAVPIFVYISFIGFKEADQYNSLQESNNNLQESFIAFAKNTCLGKTNTDAAIYQEDSSFHPIIFLDDTGEANSWTDLSSIWEWQSSLPKDLQLVACIGEEKKIGIETCHYTGDGVINRIQSMVHIRVVSVNTGKVVIVKDFYGPEPGVCPTYITGSGGDLNGGSVSEDDVKAWLINYVNPPQSSDSSSITKVPILESSILLQPGDLPNNHTLGDINSSQKWVSIDMPEAPFELYAPIEKTGFSYNEEGILISVYGSKSEADDSLNAAGIGLEKIPFIIEGRDNGEGNESWIASDTLESHENEVGENRILGIISLNSEDIEEEMVFERCNAVVRIDYEDTNPVDVVSEQIIAYAKNVDQRISSSDICK